MKIKKLFIDGYGKLADREFRFSDGFNLVHGKNEAGKSTIQSFIKAMLFGFPNQREDREGRLPDNKKYEPWDGSGFGGSMEIETDSLGTLIIEKDFRNKRDGVFGPDRKDITADFPYRSREGLLPGEKLLNMDRDCFENTAFISQGGTVVLKNDRKNLFEKLMNLAQTGSESTSVAKAVSAIRRAKTALGNNNTRNRPFNNISKKISELESMLGEAAERRKKLARDFERMRVLEGETADLDEMLRRSEVLSEAAQLYGERDKLRGIRNSYDDLSDKINGISEEIFKLGQQDAGLSATEGISEEETLENIRLAASSAEKQKGLICEDPDSLLAGLEESRKKKRLAIILCYAGITLSAVAALLFHPVIFALTFIITALLIYLHMKKPKFTRDELIEQIRIKKECNEDITMINAFIESAGRTPAGSFDEAGAILREIFNKKSSARDIQKQLQGLRERKSDLTVARDQSIRGYDSISEIESLLETTIARLTGLGISEEDASPSANERIKTEYKEKMSELTGIRAVIRNSLQSDEEISGIEEELDFQREQLASVRTEIKALDLAQEALAAASSRLQEDIFPEINEKSGPILDIITGGSHSVLITDRDKDMKTESGSRTRSPWEFSDGTIDQMYFALRIAAADAFSEKEPVPILIDEAFAYYDEERLRNTFKYLSDISADRQIILFTCKENEVEEASSLDGVSIIRL